MGGPADSLLWLCACMLRNLTIWLAVMPPLKAWRQLSRVMTATQRLGKRYITWGEVRWRGEVR